MINLSRYYHYIGNPNCRYLESGRSEALELVARSIYHDFPEARDRLLYVADASPVSGGCPGHPGLSHGGKVTVDVDYYTLLESNNTQRWNSTLKPVAIWREPGETLLPDSFDWLRNFVFAARIMQIMPGTTYRTNKVLNETMFNMAVVRYGRDIAQEVTRNMTKDTGTTYNHHIHAHLDLGEMDTCFRINDFLGDEDE